MNNKNTSWGAVSGWYDELLEGDKDSYQTKVILPNLLRLMDIKAGEFIFDNACGQGFFAEHFSSVGAKVSAADLSRELINIAKDKCSKKIDFFVAPADKVNEVKSNTIDKSSIILALQNIKDIDPVFAEMSRVLKDDGKLFIVLNHPAFRIPKQTEWGYDQEKKIQYRRVDSYLSESNSRIDMNPGKEKRTYTVSFHRPLQVYFKLLRKNGFIVSRFEEWISHKKSQPGERSDAEDKARKEIPMFLFIEAIKNK